MIGWCARPCAVGAAKDRVSRALPGSGLPCIQHRGASVCVIRVSLDGKDDAPCTAVCFGIARFLYGFSAAALTDVH